MGAHHNKSGYILAGSETEEAKKREMQGTGKGYINTVFTDINVALITYTLQGIFPP